MRGYLLQGGHQDPGDTAAPSFGDEIHPLDLTLIRCRVSKRGGERLNRTRSDRLARVVENEQPLRTRIEWACPAAGIRVLVPDDHLYVQCVGESEGVAMARGNGLEGGHGPIIAGADRTWRGGIRDTGVVNPQPGSVRPGSARRVTILGSTGSVGIQALDVIRRNPRRFSVVGLGAGGSDIATLAEQALEFGVEVVAVARATAAQDLLLAFYAAAQRRGYHAGEYAVPKILAGPDASTELAAYHCDVVLNAITGSVGLAPTLAALQAGRTLALANKESLIVGGPLVRAVAAPGQIVPVDSEHSALAQCLRAGTASEVSRLLLTASGGPFRGRSRDELTDVTPDEALAHPTWDMGPVVTCNSATMMNKGLEVIEAHLLFDVPYDRIDVVVHPQSVVHSMVEFVDGSTVAQVSPPDMRLPIALGLGWPDRVSAAASACDWTTATTWDFLPLDENSFPAVGLARRVGEAGGTAPAVLNAANESCVEAFLDGRLPFLGIVDTVARVVDEHLRGAGQAGVAGDVTGSAYVGGNDLTLADVLTAEVWARARAQQVSDVLTERVAGVPE